MVDENIITLKEAAQKLGRNYRYFLLMARQGEIKSATKIGGRWYVNWDILINGMKVKS